VLRARPHNDDVVLLEPIPLRKPDILCVYMRYLRVRIKQFEGHDICGFFCVYICALIESAWRNRGGQHMWCQQLSRLSCGLDSLV
jgi:hypothetical protein